MKIYNRFDELVGEFRWNNCPTDAGTSEVASQEDSKNMEEEWNSDEPGGSSGSSIADRSELFDKDKCRVVDAQGKSDAVKEDERVTVEALPEYDVVMEEHRRDLGPLTDEEVYAVWTN